MSTSHPTTPSSGATHVLAIGVALIVVTVLPGFLVASLAPRIRADFPFEDAALGASVAAFNLVSAVASAPAGSLVDRIGPTRGMRLAAACSVSSCLAAAAFARSAAGLVLALLVGGVANALGGPTVTAMFRALIPEHRQGLAFGVGQSGASLSALAAGLALPLVAIPFGWRWAFVGCAAAMALTFVLAPRQVPNPTPRARAQRRRGLSSIHGIALAAGLGSAACVGMVSFLVSYSVDSGMTETEAGLLLGAVSLAAALGRVVLGVALDRSGADPLAILTWMLALSAIGFFALIVGSPVAIVIAAMVASTLGWTWSGALNLAVVRRSPDAPSHAVGTMLGGLFTGAVGGPLSVGLLADHGHFAAAWVACGLFALGSATTLGLLRRWETQLQPAT